jgi:hypothetical protein
MASIRISDSDCRGSYFILRPDSADRIDKGDRCQRRLMGGGFAAESCSKSESGNSSEAAAMFFFKMLR